MGAEVKRKQKLNQKYEPPEGYMWFKGKLMEIKTVEFGAKIRMGLSDRVFGGGEYRTDPSYNWAEEVKAKRVKR